MTGLRAGLAAGALALAVALAPSGPAAAQGAQGLRIQTQNITGAISRLPPCGLARSAFMMSRT